MPTLQSLHLFFSGTFVDSLTKPLNVLFAIEEIFNFLLTFLQSASNIEHVVQAICSVDMKMR